MWVCFVCFCVCVCVCAFDRDCLQRAVMLMVNLLVCIPSASFLAYLLTCSSRKAQCRFEPNQSNRSIQRKQDPYLPNQRQPNTGVNKFSCHPQPSVGYPNDTKWTTARWFCRDIRIRICLDVVRPAAPCCRVRCSFPTCKFAKTPFSAGSRGRLS